jgi:rod shape-determining protein MreD
MTAARRFGPRVEMAAILVLGAAAIHLALLPVSLGVPGPDLVYCLVAAWVVRRPGEAPLWAVLGLGLAADVFLSRPLGLVALGLLLTAEALRSNAASLRSGSFVFEWLTVAGLFVAMQLCMHAALQLTFADGPAIGALMRHAGATAVAYPLVVAALALGLGLRPTRRGHAPDRLGRIA